MQYKKPENSDKYHWTQHVQTKMLYYGLSSSRVVRILRNPDRLENGIALNTVAVMQKTGSKAKPQEIWVMYQEKTKGKKQEEKTMDSFSPNLRIIISAWRYPGISPKNKPLSIPEDVLEDLNNFEMNEQ